MADGLLGADADALRALARDLEHAQSELLAVRGGLSAHIALKLHWEGPDAFVFRHAWQSSYAPVIGRAATLLGDTARALAAEAAAQETASR
ncbi:hypothetical protein AL755_07225 [Arthrobacter sp. ERGS1:01]|uniref:hypothetical protein n=1 Tax=Arthrobacter sp. ERGS1:01 TaxID=1704044 RepID=UPI0006B53C6B|nr:hypothetical protein [Arthrobacter sp. ERGS1:01]ALE05309.1 hypothetical protein AL755_07225 [Arthrobacter sp. ERGS1:01]